MRGIQSLTSNRYEGKLKTSFFILTDHLHKAKIEYLPFLQLAYAQNGIRQICVFDRLIGLHPSCASTQISAVSDIIVEIFESETLYRSHYRRGTQHHISLLPLSLAKVPAFLWEIGFKIGL